MSAPEPTAREWGVRWPKDLPTLGLPEAVEPYRNEEAARRTASDWASGGVVLVWRDGPDGDWVEWVRP